MPMGQAEEKKNGLKSMLISFMTISDIQESLLEISGVASLKYSIKYPRDSKMTSILETNRNTMMMKLTIETKMRRDGDLTIMQRTMIQGILLH